MVWRFYIRTLVKNMTGMISIYQGITMTLTLIKTAPIGQRINELASPRFGGKMGTMEQLLVTPLRPWVLLLGKSFLLQRWECSTCSKALDFCTYGSNLHRLDALAWRFSRSPCSYVEPRTILS
jgi:hypothetical protein